MLGWKLTDKACYRSAVNKKKTKSITIEPTIAHISLPWLGRVR